MEWLPLRIGHRDVIDPKEGVYIPIFVERIPRALTLSLILVTVVVNFEKKSQQMKTKARKIPNMQRCLLPPEIICQTCFGKLTTYF